MAVKTKEVTVWSTGRNLDGTAAIGGPDSDFPGVPITNVENHGSAIPIGNGVFPTAGHLLEAVLGRSAPQGPVSLSSDRYLLDGITSNNYNFIQGWNPVQVYNNSPGRIITGGTDLAALRTNVSVPDGDLSPFVVFGDAARVEAYFNPPAPNVRDKTIYTSGRSNTTTTGQFVDVEVNQIYSLNTIPPGDSGGAAYIQVLGIDDIISVVSTGKENKNTGVPEPGLWSDYLNPQGFYRLAAQVAAGSGNNFNGLSLVRPH